MPDSNKTQRNLNLRPVLASRAGVRAAGPADSRGATGALARRIVPPALVIAAIVAVSAYLGQATAYRAELPLTTNNAATAEAPPAGTAALADAESLSAAGEANGEPVDFWRRLLEQGGAGFRSHGNGWVVFADAPSPLEATRRCSALGQMALKTINARLTGGGAAESNASGQVCEQLERLAMVRDSEAAAGGDIAPVLAHFQQLRRQIEQDAVELSARRAELTALRAQAMARNALDPAKLQEALQADPVLAEDAREIERNAETLRSEIQLALERLPEVLESLNTALHGVDSALTDQIELKPAPAVRSILEQLQVDVRALADRATTYAGKRSDQRQALAGLVLKDHAEELLKLQADVQGMYGQLLAAMRDFLTHARGRMADLAASGATRDAVVASAVRAGLNPLEEQCGIAEDRGRGLDARFSIRLDAAERQMRSLLNRSRERAATLQRELQEQADSTAGVKHDQDVRRLGELVGQLEQSRETALTAALTELGGVMDALRTNLTAAQQRGAAAALDDARRQLCDGEAATGRPSTTRVTLTVGQMQLHETAGEHRERVALLLGVGAFMATALAATVAVLSGRSAGRR